MEKKNVVIIDKKWLQGHNACPEGIRWVISHPLVDGPTLTQNLIDAKKLDWAYWLIVRLLSNYQKIQLAIFAATYVGSYATYVDSYAATREKIIKYGMSIIME